MAIITQDDLLQYLYNETSVEKENCIKKLLDTDEAVKERMLVLLAGKERLKKIELMSPSTRTLDNILQYAEREINQLS